MLLLKRAPEWCWLANPLRQGLTGLSTGILLAPASSAFLWKQWCGEQCCIPDPALAWKTELGRGFSAALSNWGGCGLHQDQGVLKNISFSISDPVKVKTRYIAYLQVLMVSEQKGAYLSLCTFVLTESCIWNSGWLEIDTIPLVWPSVPS